MENPTRVLHRSRRWPGAGDYGCSSRLAARLGIAWFVAVASFVPVAAGAVDATATHGIHVIDDASGRGVPMAALETTNHVCFMTDSAGWAAFDETALVGRRVFFSVRSPGYVLPAGPTGLPGVVVDARAGGTTELRLMRMNIAERMYRSTGQGIYRETTRLGHEAPLPRPNLNGAMMTHCGVQAVVFEGRIFWTWREVTGLADPQPLPRAVGAFSDLPEKGGLDPMLGIHFEYLGATTNGPAGALFDSSGPGVVRLDGLLVVKDAQGTSHLMAHYKIEGASGRPAQHGLAEFDPTSRLFEPVTELGEDFAWQSPLGHAVPVKDDQGSFFYFANPFPVTRVAASYEALTNPSEYQALVRAPKTGDLHWQTANPPVTQADERSLIAAKQMKKEDARMQLQDSSGGGTVTVSSADVAWNAYRKRWVMIASGSAGLGGAGHALWYAESDKAEGPWKLAMKVADEAGTSLDDPSLHPFFDQDGGRWIYFEATVSASTGPSAMRVPRYEQNQMMFRLDLSEERLAPVTKRR